MDVHDYPDDLRTSVGRQPITYLSEKFQKCDVRIVPVTGTLTDRGSEYLKAVRDINSRTSDGICLRLARDELEDPVFLEHLVLTALDALVVSPSHTDIVLNFDFVGGDKPDRLRSVALEALEVISRIGPFRNVVLSGTSIPAQLGRRTQGEVLRLRRVELDVWMDVMRTVRASMPIALGDHGVIEIHHTPPGKPIRVPARIRYTTQNHHVIRRADRKDYLALCKELLSSSDYCGPNFSFGDQRMYVGGKFSPGPAVGNDTNHHLEFVSDQVWRQIQASGRANLFALPEFSPRPWLAQILDVEHH